MPSKKTSKRSRGGRRAKAAADDLDLGTDKLYFKIGEVADIVDVPAYVLRYWETEFRAVRPQKSRSQQRVYRRKDVETLLRIKHLLYERKFTIAGARQELEDSKAKARSGESLERAAPSPAYLARQSLGEVRAQLASLAKMLRSDEESATLAADPAAFVRERGGALAIMAGNAEQLGGPQPLLDRPERDGTDPAPREAHN